MVGDDLALRDGKQVESLELHPASVGHEALELLRPVEGAGGTPMHRHPVALGDHRIDLEGEVRDRGEDAREVVANAVRGDHVGEAVEAVLAPGLPGRHRSFEVLGHQRVEVLANDLTRQVLLRLRHTGTL